MVRASGFDAVAQGSNPLLTSRQDLFPVVAGQLYHAFASCQLGLLIVFLLKFKLFLSDYQKRSACELA